MVTIMLTIAKPPNNCFFGEMAKLAREQRSLFCPSLQSHEFTGAPLSGSSGMGRREEVLIAPGPTKVLESLSQRRSLKEGGMKTWTLIFNCFNFLLFFLSGHFQ